jgi:hypothetical protein
MEFAKIERDGDLMWNPDFLSNDPNTRKRIDDILKQCEDTGWVPIGCGTRGFVVKHEAAHRVLWFIKDHYHELYLEIADIILAALKSGKLHRFSKHATSENLQEAFCDIYGAIYYMPEHSKPQFVRKIHALLESYKIPVMNSNIPTEEYLIETGVYY